MLYYLYQYTSTKSYKERIINCLYKYSIGSCAENNLIFNCALHTQNLTGHHCVHTKLNKPLKLYLNNMNNGTCKNCNNIYIIKYKVEVQVLYILMTNIH